MIEGTAGSGGAGGGSKGGSGKAVSAPKPRHFFPEDDGAAAPAKEADPLSRILSPLGKDPSRFGDGYSPGSAVSPVVQSASSPSAGGAPKAAKLSPSGGTSSKLTPPSAADPASPESSDDGGATSLVPVITGRALVARPEGKPYVTYQLEVTDRDVGQSWHIYRRYKEFWQLNRALAAAGVKLTSFPGKKVGGAGDTEFLHVRARRLARWLEDVMKACEMILEPGTARQVADFLTSRPNTAPPHTEAVTPIDVSAAPTASAPTASSKRVLAIATGDSPVSRKPLASPMPVPGASSGNTAPLGRAYSPGNAAGRPRDTGHRKGARRKRVDLASFNLLKVIGKGSFGKVLLVRDKETHRVYAMKMLSKEAIVRRKQVEHTKTERNVLASTRHPNVVCLHYAFQSSTQLYLVLDYCAGGELFYHIARLGRFKEDMARFYAAQISLALGHLHSCGVVYRDLKPENVLVDHTGNIKLADFGLSKMGITSGTEGTKSFCGTPEYLAPEILDRTGHGNAVDWWSLGMLLFEMLTGLPPWYTRDRKKLYERIRSAELVFPPHIGRTARSVVTALLNRDPARRLGSQRDVEEIKAHPFFAPIDWRAMEAQRLATPFAPQLASEVDTSYFDKQFTRLDVEATVRGSRRAEEGGSGRDGGAGGSAKSVEMDSKEFRGFSFAAPGLSASAEEDAWDGSASTPHSGSHARSHRSDP